MNRGGGGGALGRPGKGMTSSCSLLTKRNILFACGILFFLLNFYFILNWMNDYQKQIYEQKKEIERLDRLNKVLENKLLENQANSEIDRKRIDDVLSSCKNASNQAILGSKSKKVQKFLKVLDDYTVFHDQTMKGEKPPRFMKCVLINGWGNVLQEAVSCLLFAMASQRAVLFYTPAIEGYMPFRKFLVGLPFDGYNLAVLDRYQELVIPRFNLTCLDYDSILDQPYVTVHLTYDYYAPNVLINPFHGQKWMDILPENYFQLMLNYLWKLAPELQKEVDLFKLRYFGKYTIGIQIRAPTYRTDKKDDKDHKGMPVPPLGLFAQAAEQLSRFQDQVPYDEVVWFLATQNKEFIQTMQNAYGKKKVVTFDSGPITTTFEPNSEGQKISLLTWWLLGEANEVIATEASSYGTTAASRGGVTPIVCNHKKYCERRMSPTPCQDTHFLVDQPQECLLELRKMPHHYVSAPDSSCGSFKWEIYTSKEYSQDSWNIVH